MIISLNIGDFHATKYQMQNEEHIIRRRSAQQMNRARAICYIITSLGVSIRARCVHYTREIKELRLHILEDWFVCFVLFSLLSLTLQIYHQLPQVPRCDVTTLTPFPDLPLSAYYKALWSSPNEKEYQLTGLK